MSNTLTTLDTRALDAVTGGKSIGGSTSSSSNDNVLSTLNNIQSSLKDLKAPQQSAFGSPTNVMLFALLASRRQQSASVVVVPRRSW